MENGYCIKFSECGKILRKYSLHLKKLPAHTPVSYVVINSPWKTQATYQGAVEGVSVACSQGLSCNVQTLRTKSSNKKTA